MSIDRGLYQRITEALAQCDIHQSPAELHGVICGFLAGGGTPERDQLLALLAQHAELPTRWPPEIESAWMALHDEAVVGFTGNDLSLSLLLPVTNAPLAERISSLGEWSDGFLAGFATGHASNRVALEDEVHEALEDLVAISQIGIKFEDGNDAACRAHLEEITEHCRMSAILVFTELALKRRTKKKVQQ